MESGSEAVLQAVGDLGPYQVLQMVLQMFSSVVNAIPTLIVVFIGYEPGYVCNSVNETTDVRPRLGEFDGEIVSLDYGKCSIAITVSQNGTNTSHSLTCVAGVNFSMPSDTSFLTEWSLVCQKQGLVELSQTLIMAGMALGALVFSSLSDRFGRKTVYVGSAMGLLLTTCLTSVVPNYILFLVLRVLTGALQQGIGLAAYTLFMELLPQRWRSICSVVDGTLWTLGSLLMATVAYFMQGLDWRHLNLALSACFLYSLLLPCFLDESVRWLMATGQTAKVERILEKACRMNGTNVDNARRVLAKLSAHHGSGIDKDSKSEPKLVERDRNMCSVIKQGDETVVCPSVLDSAVVKEDVAASVNGEVGAVIVPGQKRKASSYLSEQEKVTLVKYNHIASKEEKTVDVIENEEGHTNDTPILTITRPHETESLMAYPGKTYSGKGREEVETSVGMACCEEGKAESATFPSMTETASPAPLTNSVTYQGDMLLKSQASTSLPDEKERAVSRSISETTKTEENSSKPMSGQGRRSADVTPDADHKTNSRTASTPADNQNTNIPPTTDMTKADNSKNIASADIMKSIVAYRDNSVVHLEGDDDKEVNLYSFSQLEPSVAAKYTVLDLFRHREVLVPLFVCTFVWTSNSLYYYGVMLGSATWSGNRFLNFAILSLMDIPAAILAYFLLPRVNRKPLSMTFGTLAGSSLLLSVVLIHLVGTGAALTAAQVVGFAGKFCLSGSYSVLFLFCLEVFPTSMRTEGMGFASAVSRSSGMLAPFVILLGKNIAWAPGVIMCSLSLLATLSITLLPETRHRQLPDTIEKIRAWKS